MIYKILEDQLMGTLIVKIDDSGVPTWLGLREQDPEYIEWIEEGNVPEVWTPDSL